MFLNLTAHSEHCFDLSDLIMAFGVTDIYSKHCWDQLHWWGHKSRSSYLFIVALVYFVIFLFIFDCLLHSALWRSLRRFVVLVKSKPQHQSSILKLLCSAGFKHCNVFCGDQSCEWVYFKKSNFEFQFQKSSLHRRYYAEVYNEWRGPSPRPSAWTTQLNVAAMAASCWRHCARFDRPPKSNPRPVAPIATAWTTTVPDRLGRGCRPTLKFSWYGAGPREQNSVLCFLHEQSWRTFYYRSVSSAAT